MYQQAYYSSADDDARVPRWLTVRGMHAELQGVHDQCQGEGREEHVDRQAA